MGYTSLVIGSSFDAHTSPKLCASGLNANLARPERCTQLRAFCIHAPHSSVTLVTGPTWAGKCDYIGDRFTPGHSRTGVCVATGPSHQYKGETRLMAKRIRAAWHLGNERQKSFIAGDGLITPWGNYGCALLVEMR